MKLADELIKKLAEILSAQLRQYNWYACACPFCGVDKFIFDDGGYGCAACGKHGELSELYRIVIQKKSAEQ
jgi:uncharacterized Zn finger protein (UPF0148 family)